MLQKTEIGPPSAGHKRTTCGCPGEMVKLQTSLTPRTKHRAAHNTLFIQNCYHTFRENWEPLL